MWPFSKVAHGRDPIEIVPRLPDEVLEAGILAGKGEGVHLAMLYATMLGFPHELLRDADARAEFIEYAQRPPDFVADGVRRAVDRTMADIDVLFGGSSYDTLVYGVHGDRNRHLRTVLDPFREVVARFGAERTFAAAAFDVADFVQRTSVARRSRDLAAITRKLDEKRPWLEPILVRARADGINRYGDFDGTRVLAELAAFLETYFDERSLPFFYGHLPLSLCVDHVWRWFECEADAGGTRAEPSSTAAPSGWEGTDGPSRVD